MSKLAVVIWTIAAPTLMGIFVLTVLVIPGLSDHDMRLIPSAALAGAVAAAPVSYVVARLINRARR